MPAGDDEFVALYIVVELVIRAQNCEPGLATAGKAQHVRSCRS